MKRGLSAIVAVLFVVNAFCQTATSDSSDVEAVRRIVNLSEVVVRNDLDVAAFLRRIKNDTTYYKAFKNLHVLGYTALNFIQMRDKKGQAIASLDSKTQQHVTNGCRTMEVLQEKTTGDIYDRHHQFNYYTGELYAAFFFANGKICGETNIVKGSEHSVAGKKGLDKNVEQLKMLFFNPGKKIPGIPFIGNKMDVFDKDIANHYNYAIDTAELNGFPCYVFSIKRKDDLGFWGKGDIVFDNITTWFNEKTMEIVGRKYDMSYGAGVYNFDVHMEVHMTKYKDYLVPQVLRYSGDWFLITKGHEKGIFTATLYDFNR